MTKRMTGTLGMGAWAAGMALALSFQLGAPVRGVAQETGSEEERVLSVARSALVEISEENPVGLTDLMIEDAVTIALPPGQGTPRVSTRAVTRERAMTSDFVERGFGARAEVHGPIATVWLPYDFYRDGEWSHCGVDLFTLVRSDDEWLIASLVYTVDQPPACAPHPDGPPGG